MSKSTANKSSVRKLLNGPNRWRKHTFENHGRYCLVGAVEACYSGSVDQRAILNKIKKELGVVEECSIYDWNDDPKRKFKDIKKLVEKLKI